jgi:uncharacterized protein
MLFRSRQKQIEDQMAAYRDRAYRCVTEMKSSFMDYLENGDLKTMEDDAEKVHCFESEADDIRREIEDLMYSRSLFPESRGDILGLLESMDDAPGQAQDVIRQIANQRITIPEKLHGHYTDLIDIAVRSVEVMLEASEKLFTNMAAVTALTGRIDELESRGDGIESALIRQIFTSDMKTLEKILNRDLAFSIGNISDRAELAGDRIRIIVVKRAL